MSYPDHMNSETKHERFKRLAKNRGERALKDIQLVGNLSDRNNYDYTDADVKKLFSVLDEELKIAKARFASKRKRQINL